MSNEQLTQLATKIRDDILDDVTDRRGWRQEWDGFSNDIQEEIGATWLDAITLRLKEAGLLTEGP